MEIAEQIQTMLKDTCKGLATKEELKTGIAEAVAKDMKQQKAESDKMYNKAVAEIAELNEQCKMLDKQIKRLLNTRFDDIKTPEGFYSGVWPSLGMAKNFGLFLMADIAGNQDAAKELDDVGIERRRMLGNRIVSVKDMEGTSITSAGAVIPTYFMGVLPALLGRFGVFREDALEWPMASDSSYGAVPTSDVVVYAPGSGNQPTESSPGFKNVGLNAKKMMTLTAIDSEVTEDMAIAIGEVVGRSIARAFAKNEDKMGFLGDGTSTYFGFIGIGQALLNVDSSIANIMGIVVQATAGAWSAIVKNDVLGMVGAIDGDVDDEDCKFYCHRNFYFTVLVSIALGLGGVNATEIIQTGYSREPRFLGRKVRNVTVMPRVKPSADHFPLFLGNLKQAALLGQARGVTIDQSKEAYFKTDQIGIRGTERVAINVHGVGTKKDATNPLPAAVVGLRGDIA